MKHPMEIGSSTVSRHQVRADQITGSSQVAAPRPSNSAWRVSQSTPQRPQNAASARGDPERSVPVFPPTGRPMAGSRGDTAAPPVSARMRCFPHRQVRSAAPATCEALLDLPDTSLHPSAIERRPLPPRIIKPLIRYARGTRSLRPLRVRRGEPSCIPCSAPHSF